jgi:hypothetical protein
MAKIAAGKIKIIAIIASLAALALVLSPTFSLLQVPGTNKASGTEDSFSDDAVFKPDDTVVEDVSDEDLAACSSLNNNLDNILGVRNDTQDDRKVASDLLLAEFCSRPTLIHEIMSTDYQGMTLAAYACDASAGKIGTEAIQESLSVHSRIYCDSARVLILNESNTFLATVEEFRTTYIPLLEAGYVDEEETDPDSVEGDQTEEAPSNFNATEARMTLDKVEESLEQSIELVHQFEYYEAAKSFDNASKMFIAIFAEEDEPNT